MLLILQIFCVETEFDHQVYFTNFIIKTIFNDPECVFRGMGCVCVSILCRAFVAKKKQANQLALACDVLSHSQRGVFTKFIIRPPKYAKLCHSQNLPFDQANNRKQPSPPPTNVSLSLLPMWLRAGARTFGDILCTNFTRLFQEEIPRWVVYFLSFVEKPTDTTDIWMKLILPRWLRAGARTFGHILCTNFTRLF